MPHVPPSERFQTTQVFDSKTSNQYIDRTNTFGPHQARELRKNLDLTTKKYILENNAFQDTAINLKKQIKTNVM